MVATLVPWQRLSQEQLRRLVESFVLREGTDYGDVECDHDEKIDGLVGQIQRGGVVITFDPRLESFNLLPAEQWHDS